MTVDTVEIRNQWARLVGAQLLFVLCVIFGIATAHAAVAIQGTRVIYSEEDREQIVKLSNRSEGPALVQNWIDAGDPDLAAGSQNVPFLLTPPMVRIEANQGQTLRLIHVPGLTSKLPEDRESVYYLNVLEIPSKREADGKNTLQLAVRTRIKLFFRPEGIIGSSRDAAGVLMWEVAKEKDGYTALVRNPSNYHVSINQVQVGGSELESPGMVAPRGELLLKLKGVPRLDQKNAMRFEWLDDYGATRWSDALISRVARDSLGEKQP